MNEHSRTAVLIAVARGVHAEMAADPILNDRLASELYTQDEAERITDIALKASLSEKQRRQLGDSYSKMEAWKMIFRHGILASSIARNRYAEDCLEKAVWEDGIEQHVILGAGLDTCAFRRPDLAEELTIFELDHPASQRFKRERLNLAGLTPPDSVHFVPVDFETETVASALSTTVYTTDRPAFYSWLGVTPYLSPEAIFATLESIAEGSPEGTQLVFDFADSVGADPATATVRARRFMRMVEKMGEPIQDGLELAEFEGRLARRGFRLLELLDTEDKRRRYFSDQPEHLEPMEHYHFAHLIVDFGTTTSAGRESA